MNVNELNSTLKFVSQIINKDILFEQQSFSNTSSFCSEYYDRYILLSDKLPYHINIIDELRDVENAHSRILRGLFKQKSNGRYEILESFINDLLPDFNISVKTPIVTDEKYRIDLLVREEGKYAIIFENKINNAGFQDRQIGRYIDLVKSLGYNDKQIFIVYLPPTNDKEIPDDCWLQSNKEESYKESYSERSATITFKDDIIRWLEFNVLPNCKVKDIYIQSTVIQYIDHLKGRFDVRENNKIMNEELQNYIKEELQFGDSPEHNFNITIQKIREINKALGQLDNIKNSTLDECFKSWHNNLSNRYPKTQCFIARDGKYIKVGLQCNLNTHPFSILIEYNHNTIYYGLGRHHATNNIIKEIKEQLIEVLRSVDRGFKFTDWWYGWKL